ncbi:bifunctional 4-hydroxy-2-oxoglutarate aldolase/2-dehydro-3-deoxy-phosphogluconate aldolase [Puniceicoccales bacterium CK1056]|uniref:2-dehydro-3-deoxy-phosphogluconate aldolase n=1 Tax=Oceanipulchritudo coccoides TaxID=2706888 RepID=A0A6B2M045_9BACT|nr:bifunctional 4-hydroxy-2-oxoglutarate aldolase/2-dehydro-3-deoxy-phosphogluconate aldolase [Oceanipulchritudo coccoides]NDV61706.1 bifunctional 4-hydroxy-2-oxoglutarate aldolase/2-dehydro-3-deoxy-phosphogluconate aldolase [Oceanipulchritudo coccoides]
MSLESITKSRLVPVAVIPSLSSALPLAEALMEAGLPHIEVTLRTDCALEAMRAICKEFPEMTIGAGTILDATVLPELVEMGVTFGVSPGLNPEVIEKAQSLDFQMIPGVITPGEVERGLSMGLKLLKFFPAEAAGGVKMLKALAGPYGHTSVQFVPTGGINAANAQPYLDLKITRAIGGSWFVDQKLVADGDFEQIKTLTRAAIKLATPN